MICTRSTAMLSLLKIDSYAYKHVIHAKKRVSGRYFGTRTATATPAITIVVVRIRLYTFSLLGSARGG